MRWKTGRRSSNVEDRRGGGSGGQMPTGGIGGRRMPMRRRTVASGGLGLVVVVVLGLIFGVDPSVLIGLTGQLAPQSDQGMPPPQLPGQSPGLASGRQDELAQFVSVVLADTEDTWNTIFRQGGADYREPKLVLFTDYVRSACGLTGVRGRTLLLSCRSEGLHRPVLLRRAAEQVPRPGRLRPGLCHRPRGRPSRAEPARHLEPGDPGPTRRRQARVQSPVGDAGVAGRLPGGRLGATTPTTSATSWSRAISKKP